MELTRSRASGWVNAAYVDVPKESLPENLKTVLAGGVKPAVQVAEEVSHAPRAAATLDEFDSVIDRLPEYSDPTGQKLISFDAKDVSQEEFGRIQETLKQQGLNFTAEENIIGRHVIKLDSPEDAAKLQRLQDGSVLQRLNPNAAGDIKSSALKSFSEVIAESADIIAAKKVDELSSNAIVALSRDPELIEEIEQHLKELGHEKFEFVGNGSDAFALRTESGKVIRFDEEIRHNETLERASVKQVLQVDGDYARGGMRYEIMDDAPSLYELVDQGKMTKAEAIKIAEDLETGLAKEGYVALDLGESKTGFRLDNIGLKADGTPVIIDPGCHLMDVENEIRNNPLAKEDKFAERFRKGILDRYENSLAKPDPPYDWSSEQAKIDAKSPLVRAPDVPELDHVATNGLSAEERSIAEARALAKTADTLEGVQELSKMAKLARMGGNVPLVGMGIALGATALTHIAHESQKDMAQEFNKQDILSNKAYEKYLELNSDIEKVLGGDTSISVIDPTGASIVVTAGVDVWAQGKFKEWADEYAPNLSEEQYQTLAMSLYSGNSARAEMMLESAEHLPKSVEGQPEALYAMIDANKALEDAKLLQLTRGDNDPDKMVALKEAVDEAQANLIAEMDKLIADPEQAQAQAFLEMLPMDERMDYVRMLAKSEDDPAAFAEKHPEVAAYAAAYEEAGFLDKTVFGFDEEDKLERNTQLINDYIIARSKNLETDQAVRPEIAVAGVLVEPDKGYTKGVEGTPFTTELVNPIIVGPPKLNQGELTAQGMSMPAIFNTNTVEASSEDFKMVNAVAPDVVAQEVKAIEAKDNYLPKI